MVTRQTTIRLPERTDQQLAELADLYGDRTKALVVAIDRLYQAEADPEAQARTYTITMDEDAPATYTLKAETGYLRWGAESSGAIDRLYEAEKGNLVMKIEVATVNTMPEIDPYHGDTGQLAAVAFWLDPQKRRCGIGPDYDDRAMDAKDYHSITYNLRLAQAPDQDEARAYLEGKAQGLLRAICDGHTIDWDGRNMVGSLTQEAEEALQMLIDDLDTMRESDWTLWEVDDWLNQSDLEVTPDATDEQLQEMAEAIQKQATDDHIIIDSRDLLAYLKEQRDE